MSHLILQSPSLIPQNLEKIAAMVSADGIQTLKSPTVVRLLNADADQKQAVHQACQEMRMDYAFLPEIHLLRECKLLAMDMDSTLITIECIDEIADAVGKKAEVAAITEATMRGEIKDFSESLRQRVALLEGIPESALQAVYDERLRLNMGAERLIQVARQHGLHTLLVSGGFTFFTQRLQERLHLDSAAANELEVKNGVLTGKVLGDIVDGQAKARHVRELAHSLGAEAKHIIAIGDGANDLPMMEAAHYSVAWRAKPVVQQQARYALNYSALDAVLNWFRLSF